MGDELQGSIDSGALSRALEKAVAKNKGNGGGIFRIATPTQILWQGATGFVDATRQTAISPEMNFEVASVTKTFTAAAVLAAVEDGKLTLDEPLAELLPSQVTDRLLVISGHSYGPELTPRQLLSQRSGLPDYWYDPPYIDGENNAFLQAFMADVDRTWTPLDILAFVPNLTPIGKPGTIYHYADTNFVILGLVVEAVENKPLHAVFRDRFFTPLNMHDTYFSYHEAAPATPRETDRFEARLDLHARPNQSADWAGGGLVSSTRDLETFLFALAKGRVVRSPELRTAMQSWQPTDQADISYGLGAFRIALDEGLGELWGHDGYGNSFMYYWPERNVSFTGTLNQTENDWWPIVEEALTQIASMP